MIAYGYNEYHFDSYYMEAERVHESRTSPAIILAMKKFQMNQIICTKLTMSRRNLVIKDDLEIKEKGLEKAIKNKNIKDIERLLYIHPLNVYISESVFDDLESFFENLQIGNFLQACTSLLADDSSRTGVTNFVPKLNEHETTLLEKKDSDFLKTFSEQVLQETRLPRLMEQSKSQTIFVNAYCHRLTSIKHCWSEIDSE